MLANRPTPSALAARYSATFDFGQPPIAEVVPPSRRPMGFSVCEHHQDLLRHVANRPATSLDRTQNGDIAPAAARHQARRHPLFDSTTRAAELDLQGADQEALYAAMDWLLQRHQRSAMLRLATR